MDRIITSIVDTDLYKLTMGEAAARLYSHVQAGYEFINRSHTAFPDGFDKALRAQVDSLSELSLTSEEAAFIAEKCYYLAPWYIDWLRAFRFDPSQVEIRQDGGDLGVRIEGPWYQTIYWEVPLMATISELYFRMTEQSPSQDYISRAHDKGRRLIEAGVNFADFGSRRRFSLDVHRDVVAALVAASSDARGEGRFVGTSNVMLAHELGLTPIGTNAHEWVMAHSALFGNRMANEKSMEAWSQEFGAQLGTALTDTLTTPVFLRSFGPYYAKLFDGVRQDSGDPFAFADLMVEHYKKVRVNPMHKTLIFSDGLTTDSAILIAEHCRGRIGSSFGIGTHFTNDVGVRPLNIVIKATWFETERTGRIPVCKLSDDPGKISGDPKAIEHAKYELGIT